MRFGIQLCTLGAYADPRETVRAAGAAEAAGWEALFVWDHLAWASSGRPSADPWVTLGACAAAAAAASGRAADRVALARERRPRHLRRGQWDRARARRLRRSVVRPAPRGAARRRARGGRTAARRRARRPPRRALHRRRADARAAAAAAGADLGWRQLARRAAPRRPLRRLAGRQLRPGAQPLLARRGTRADRRARPAR